MQVPLTSWRWRRYFVVRVERTRTTWLFRIVVVLTVFACLWTTSGWWTGAIARGLVCSPSHESSDAILVDNFDADYVLFERARGLRRAGVAPRVLVPVAADPDTQVPNRIGVGIALVMADAARLGSIEIVPIRLVEPITLNAALDILQFLHRENVRSVIVTTPLFRSRRASLVYGSTLGNAGIQVHCDPGPTTRQLRAWPKSWHGIQTVVEQWLKLQYYRLYVLPFWKEA